MLPFDRKMSESERELSKCRDAVMKEGDGSDLSLSGSQVSLVSRPRSVTGKASYRALSVSGPRIRRPLSAVPSMPFTEINRDKRRPYSADSRLLLSSYQRRNKLPACFSMSTDPMSLTQQDIETDGDIEFSSSTLVSSQLSDQIGGAWMELEVKGLYLRNSDQIHPSSSTDNGSDLLCSSELSEDPTRSEKSLGERIQAMARDHLHHDRAVCVHSSSVPERKQKRVECKVEDYTSSDPKQMSTKELHLRMVESGLIPASTPYSSARKQKDENGSKFGSPHSKDTNSNLENAPPQKTNDIQKRGGTEFNLHSSASNSDPSACDFWNNHHDFYQAVNQSTCGIDQVSFPKEHDIDSLGGYSSCTNSGHNSQRKLKCPSALAIEPKHDDENNIDWTKVDLGPVRFQQWVSDSRKDDALNSTGVHTSSFFCGTRNPLSHTDKNVLDHDCTVEEVSTDCEYFKTDHLSSRKEKGPLPPTCDLLSASSGCELTKTTPKSEACENEKFEEDRLRTENNLRTEDCSNSEIKLTASFMGGNQKSPNLATTLNDEQNPETLSQKSSTKDKSLESEIPRQENAVISGQDKKFDSISKASSLNGRKAYVRTLDLKKDQQLHLGTKRKNDLKVNGSTRKCGKSPSNISSRSFSPPKEETFPGETQAELLSWMSMCTDDVKERDCAVDLHTPKEPHPGANLSGGTFEDSPYNEIMTILRVLEEREDESALLRILNRRSDLGSAQDKASSEIKSPVHPERDIVHPVSVLDQNNSDVSRAPSASSARTGDTFIKVCQDVMPVRKQELKATSPKPAGVTSATDSGVSQASTQGELRDLLTFLDAVDQSCSAVLQPNSVSDPRPSSRIQATSVDSHNLEELLLMGRSDLAQEIVSLRLALEDRDATINLLRTALREQKDSQARQHADQSAELENRVRQVKSECESVIKRHQKFIDQLIADKASLSQRCETLVQDAKESEEKNTKALSVIEGKHKVEMQRIKDITAATEKLKRERWVENKTQKIKELTVRGLEPELTRLTSQHEQEMSALRTLHAQELEQMEIRAARRASQQMEVLREQLVQEKEEALTRERDMLRQRMEKQQLLFEEEGSEQRRRLVAEVRREQDRLATLEARLEAQFEEKKRGLEREAEQERDRMRRDYADKLSEMHRKQQNEILQYRESLKAEKEAWVETYQQQQKQALAQTTNEIREQLKRERDREIEVVIERLESEATISREEREKAAENRLRRVREQLTSELRDVESALNSLKEKHTELRSLVQEKEDKLVSLEALNRSLHTQLVETQKIADQLSAQRADLKQALQCELSHEMECLRQQLADQHARHQQQLQILSEQSERERQTHQQELQQLFDRVKLAIAKKEEVVKVAKAKQKSAEEQISHLQALLEHRRKESLMS